MRWTAAAIILLLSRGALGAVGCTLSNPAEDLKYLYPEMTSYKEEPKDLSRLKDGERIYKDLKERLGSDLDPLYEALDTPYTVYSVFKGEDLVGQVHGVNVPGKGGVIQVFLSLDPKSGEVRSLFFQRLESPAAKKLRDKEFRGRFAGLSLADFYKHDYYQAVEPGSDKDRVAAIPDPTAGDPDFPAALRGVRKNLILMDLLVWGRRFEPFHEKAREALKAKKEKEGGKP